MFKNVFLITLITNQRFFLTMESNKRFPIKILTDDIDDKSLGWMIVERSTPGGPGAVIRMKYITSIENYLCEEIKG